MNIVDGMLSILIPAYNPDETVLRGILASLNRQMAQYPDVEIVIVDDGSADAPLYVREYKGVVYARQPNMGEPVARNTLLALARGEWFTFIDCDDEISDDYLSVVIGNMREGWDWVAYDWTCDGSRQGAYQNVGALVLNCAVWAYSFRNGFYGDEQFNPELRLGCDTDWLGRVLKDNHRHKHDSRVIYNYRWSGNDDSLCHRKMRGEIR